MKERILHSLQQIEQENNIKVLFACETGSRAWGFASPDSDYDVRFIYMHNKDWYLSLNEQKDSVEIMLDNGELDITGWDLRKSLRLLKKSNISLFERFKSPEIYLGNKLFINELNNTVDSYFSPIAGMHHYLNMAKGFYEKCMENNTVKLKSYFYALRSALSCIWIMEYKSMPPIEFSKLVYLFTKEQGILVDELLKLKVEKDEKYLHPRQGIIDLFLKDTIDNCEKIASDLPASKGNSNLLDQFFVKMLNEI